MNNFKYEILIGAIVDMNTQTIKAEQTIIITQSQLKIIELFAHSRKDKDLNTIYKLND